MPFVELDVTFETVGNWVSYESDIVELAVFVFPAVSVKAPLAIETEPVPLCVFAVGVNTTVYDVPETAVNDESVPPLNVMSPTTKLAEVSDNVKVSVEVSPDFSVDELAEIDTVGAVVSTVTVRPEDVDVTVESASTVVDSAVTTLSPAVNTPVSHDHTPVVAFAVQVFPEATPSTYNCTVDPTGAEPVNVRVVADVMSSVPEGPKSSAVSKSGVETLGNA